MNPPNLTPRRSTWWLWLLVLTGTAIMGLMIWKFTRTTGKSNTGGDKPRPKTLPDGTPTPTNKPPKPPTNTTDVHWDYLKDLCWKADEVVKAGNYNLSGYGCEVTNGINTMGTADLAAFKDLYRNWYGRDLASDYCQVWKQSGCFVWGFFPDIDNATKACNRLK